MIKALSIALTGLDSSAKTLNTAAQNIVNAGSVGSLDGGRQAYAPVTTSKVAVPGGGVKTDIVPREPAFVPSFAPGSPFANEEGFVQAPNVNLAEELVISKTAELAYKANATTLAISKELGETLIDAIDDEV